MFENVEGSVKELKKEQMSISAQLNGLSQAFNMRAEDLALAPHAMSATPPPMSPIFTAEEMDTQQDPVHDAHHEMDTQQDPVHDAHHEIPIHDTYDMRLPEEEDRVVEGAVAGGGVEEKES
jgi:hypothetical protein